MKGRTWIPLVGGLSLGLSVLYGSLIAAQGGSVSDQDAGRLYGGACEAWDPGSCTGTTNGCGLMTKWKSDANGAMLDHRELNNVVCGSQNCGSVKQIKKCDEQ